MKRIIIFLSLLFALTTAQAQLRYPYAIKPTAACSSVQVVQYLTADSALTCHQVAYSEISGTPAAGVTSVATAAPITGGTITTTGTIACATCATTTNGGALSATAPATISAGGVIANGLASVTNDAQTKAAIVPNTAPSAGQLLVGNVGGTAYAPVTLSGSGATATMSSAGVLTLSAIPNASLSNSSITIGGTSTALGGSVLGNVTNDTQTKASIVPNTTPIAGGKILVSNIIGTAYAPVAVSGSGATVTLDSTGVLALSAIPNATLSNSSVTVAGHSVALGASTTVACADLSDSSIYCAATGANNAQTATYQVLAADFTNLKTITVASGTFTITLVASGSQPANGKHINIINYGSGVVTIARSGQNINGGTASLSIPAASATAPTSATIFSDGTNYFVSLVAGSSSSPLTTKGDLLAHSTVDARLGVGADGQTLFSDSTKTLGLAWANTSMPLRYGLHDSDDLLYGLASNGLGGRISCNGVSGGGIGSVTVAGHPGVQGITTGTSNGGDTRCGMAFTAAASGSSGMIHPGDGAFEAIIVFETTTLSAASPGRYLFVAGLSDVNTPASYTGNLIALVYSDNVNGGAVVLDVVTAGTAVVTNGTTALAANSWYAMRIVENAAYTQVDLYTRNLSTNAAEVHEVSVSGLVAGTTLPATSVGMGLVADLLNQNGSISSSVNLDGMEYTYMLASPR